GDIPVTQRHPGIVEVGIVWNEADDAAAPFGDRIEVLRSLLGFTVAADKEEDAPPLRVLHVIQFLLEQARRTGQAPIRYRELMEHLLEGCRTQFRGWTAGQP